MPVNHFCLAMFLFYKSNIKFKDHSSELDTIKISNTLAIVIVSDQTNNFYFYPQYHVDLFYNQPKIQQMKAILILSLPSLTIAPPSIPSIFQILVFIPESSQIPQPHSIQYNNYTSLQMQKQMMKKSQLTSPNKNYCLQSVLRYCGLASAYQLLDQCQDHQFKKRKKISLKNFNIKNNKKCTIDQSCPQEAHIAGNYLRQLRKTYLPQQLNEFQHSNNYIYTDVPSIALPSKDIAEKPVHYQMAASSQRKNIVQKQQNKQSDQNYQQEFQRLLFDHNQEPRGQLVQYLSPCVLQQRGKILNPFEIKQSLSVYDPKESSHLSIVLPYIHSQKLTSSTIFHTKTSQSVIFPQTNHLQTSLAVSQLISDEEFKAINFGNPFKSQKSRVYV